MSEKASRINRSETSLGKVYLLVYNSIQTVGFTRLLDSKENNFVTGFISFLFGFSLLFRRFDQFSVMILVWSYMLLQTLSHFLNRGTLETFWDEIKWTVIIFQNAAVLEVLHAAIGLVPSSAIVVLMQVYSRVFLVCGSLMVSHNATVSPGLPITILAWSITEIVRYAYYALNIVKVVPKLLVFVRYSTFLILYPIGITGELLCMYYSLDEIWDKQIFRVALPNTWNFIFNYYYFLIFYMFLYLPLFPVLFGHMLSQRRKMLNIDPKKSK